MAFQQIDYKFRCIKSLREEYRRQEYYDTEHSQAMKTFFSNAKISDVFEKLRESEPYLKEVGKRAEEVKKELKLEVCKTQRFL